MVGFSPFSMQSSVMVTLRLASDFGMSNMRVLRARVQEQEAQQQADAIAADRRSQVGSGDRSERIRTYNFPQGRVTDHRIGLTLHKLDFVLNGELDELLNALITADQAEKMKRVK